MRSHGDPGQADPTIDTNKVIHITMPAGYHGGQGHGGKNKSGGKPESRNTCGKYLLAAETALRGGQTVKLDTAKLLKYSECMRANGIPDFPDPTAQGLTLNKGATGDLNPSNPTFQKATAVCARKTGVDFGSGPKPGMVMVNGGKSANG